MRILAWVHLYAPDHCAGAEMMLHEILLGLRDRGHEVHVYCDASTVTSHEGVPITARDRTPVDDLLAWSNVVVTHLDRTREVVTRVAGSRPVVHLVHNDRQLAFHGVTPGEASLVVANSAWIRDAIDWPGPTIVLPPPVAAARYRTPRQDARHVTLVNLSAAKGAALFWKVATLLPDHRFMGVIGGYGRQEIPRILPPNVVLLPHSPDMRTVYRQTRLLLMPSSYESWGRVGIEAAASGIPTIAHPTPGLLESLAASGTFVDYRDADGWAAAIRSLDDPVQYRRVSRLALARSAELDPTTALRRLETAMLDVLHRAGA